MSRPSRRRGDGDRPDDLHPPGPAGELSGELAALRAQLSEAIRRDHRRSLRRRRSARIGLVAALSALALSASALAAGAAIGVIHLGGGVTAQRIAKIPKAKGSAGEIVLGYVGCYHHDCAAKPHYVYRVSGGHARRSFGGITCGHKASPLRPRRVFVTSHVPLDHAQLRGALALVDGAKGGARAGLPQGTTMMIKLCKETPPRMSAHGRPGRGARREVGASILPRPLRPALERASTRSTGRAASAPAKAAPGRGEPPSR